MRNIDECDERLGGGNDDRGADPSLHGLTPYLFKLE
jgi:hypothetical protein